MAMVINSNIQSLNAQRHLNNSLDAQNTATERLSSGLRINSAKDDAAGLAIANRMTSQVEGLNQAIRNANDGQALIQTAEGGLEEMTNILGRMRELAIQSANGTYNTGNRDTLNGEVDQLQQEINRIAETTSFNGQNILDGSLGEIDLQVGENANQTIALEVGKLTTKNLGGAGADLIGTSGTGALLTGLQTVTATVLEINGDLVQTLTGAASLDEAVQLLDDSVAGIDVSHFVEIEAGETTSGTGALTGTDQLVITLATASSAGTNDVINISDTKDLNDIVAQINEKGGDLVSASLNDEGRLVISSTQAASITLTGVGDGLANSGFVAAVPAQQAQLKFDITDTSMTQIDVESSTSAAGLALAGLVGLNDQVDGKVTGGSGATGTLTSDSLVLNGVSISAGTGATIIDTVAAINRHTADTGVVAVTGSANTGAIDLISTDGSNIKIEAGAGITGATDELREATLFTLTGLQVMNEASSTSNTVASIDISTASGAQRAIGILTDAIDQVSETRGDLGAVANRLDHTTRNLANISENAASARSQIMDSDFAAESANLSRAQVLQQAGNAMLAQANARPQQVLSLLQ
jgi:flagellin